MTIQEKKERRAALVKEMRTVMDGTKEEGGTERALTTEERGKYDALYTDFNKLGEEINDDERREKLAGIENSDTPPHDSGTRQVTSEELAFRNYLTAGETRDLSVGDGGGALAPQMYLPQLVKALDKETFMRQAATVYTINADSMGFPSEETEETDAEWTQEVPSATTADTSLKYKKRELKPVTLVKLIKVSDRLLKVSALPIESIIIEKLGAKIGSAYEKGMLVGTGTDQPLGIFTASAKGITTSRDVTEDTSATAFTTKTLIAAKMKIRPGYRKQARWMFHPDAIKMILGMQDTNKQFLWQPAMRDGTPESILGLSYFESEYAPNTFVTGAYVGAIGDFKQYWISELGQFEIKRINELYTETNQVGFKGTMNADGMPVLEEAFARIKLGA